MRYQKLPIHCLKPAPYNPRVPLKPGDPAWQKLERSLEEFDLVQPIIWNERTGHVVGGHQRVQVLEHRGETEVDCVVVDLNLEREKVLNIALNNPLVGSTWDVDRLLVLMDELVELPQIDPTLTGFDAQEYRDVLLRPAQIRRDDELASPQQALAKVSLEIPHEHWPVIEQELNRLLTVFPDMRVHVGRGTSTKNPSRKKKA